LRPALLRAKPAGVTYLRTDTHWNQFGAFIGCQELIGTLSRQMPGLEPLPIDAFEMRTVSQPGGNLAAMLAQRATILERDCPTLTPRPPLQPLPATRTGATTLRTDNSRGKGKAVIFRDSFSEAWIPFIGYHFNQVIYCWQYNWDARLIEREKPDVVIDEMLEHYFYGQDPGSLKLADHLE
jgi:hypothetical protein